MQFFPGLEKKVDHAVRGLIKNIRKPDKFLAGFLILVLVTSWSYDLLPGVGNFSPQPKVAHATGNAWQIRQEINITDAYFAATSGNYATSSEIINIDTTKYSGTATYYLEVEASSSAAISSVIFYLKNTSGNTITSTTTNQTTSYNLYRSNSFTPTPGANDYVLVIGNQSGGTKGVKSARIVIIQNFPDTVDQAATSTETQIEIGNEETGKSNTTNSALTSPKYWDYSASKWDGAITAYAEVTYSNTQFASTTTWRSPGTFTNNYKVSPGTSYTSIQLWGGGGTGGSATGNSGARGGGGAGGQYAASTTTLPIGNTYTVVVAGTSTASSNGVVNGNDSTFNTSTVVAKGGAGGAISSGTSSSGGTGSTASGVGTTVFAGGSGGNGTVAGNSGGGGGGAGSSGTGNSGSAGTAGTAKAANGGAGGTGVSANAAINNGFVAGGGGAGGLATASTNEAGGNGAPGWAVITETIGQVSFALEEDDGNFGSWTFKTMIVNNGVSTSSPIRVRSSAFSPVDGRHYRIVASSTNATATYNVYNAKIILDQSYLTDSYSQTNKDNQNSICGSGCSGSAIGQSFTSTGGILSSAVFYMSKTGSPSGTAVAKLYAHTGTFGATGGIPTGAPLATSDTLDVSTFATFFTFETFTFSGANQYAMTNGTNYVIVVEYTGGDVSNNPTIGFDFSSPTHPGDTALYTGTWSSTPTEDTPFYVYVSSVTKLEPQYLLSNTALSSGTGLQSFLEKWDSSEWSGVSNTYLHAVDSANSSASAAELDTTAGTLIVGSTVSSPSNQSTSTSMTMPANGNIDVKATTNNNDIYANRVLVQTSQIIAVTIGGTVYSSEGGSNIGSGKTISMYKNGSTLLGSAVTNSSGVYSVSLGTTIASGDIITAYINGDTTKGATIYKSDGTAPSNVDIYGGALIVRADTGSITNANIATGWVDDYTDMMATTSGATNLTATSSAEVHVWTADTYSPGGTVTTQSAGSLHLSSNSTATLDTATNAIAGDIVVDTGATLHINADTTVGGNLTTSGTGVVDTTSGTPTVSMTGVSPTIGGGSSALTFYNLTAAGSFLSGSPTMTINHTFDGSNATVSFSGGTVTMATTGWSITKSSGTISFSNLTISETPTTQPSITFTVSGALTVNNGKTLAPTAGTINMTGGSISNSGTLNFNNLTIAGNVSTSATFGVVGNLTSSSGTLTTSGGTITVNGNTSVAGTISGTGNITASSTTGTPSITRAQFKHQYPATSGTGYAFTSNNTAGNLLVLAVSSGITPTSFSVSDTAGNTWSSFPFRTWTDGVNGGRGIQIFYVLNAKAGANTVTVSTTGGTDMGFTMAEYQASGGATWSVDSSLTTDSFKDGTAGATTNTPTSNSWSTAGADDLIFAAYSDETTVQTLTAGTNFTLIQSDSGHVDAQEDWMGAPAQTNQTASFNSSATMNSWAMDVAAFTASGNTINATGNGTINLTAGTFTLKGNGDFGGNTNWTFNNLTFGDSSNTNHGTTYAIGTGAITSATTTVANNQTLDAGSKTWALTAAYEPFQLQGTFTASTSQVSYQAANNATITSATYYNLGIAPSSGSPTFKLATTTGQTLTVNHNFTLGGVCTATVDANTYDPNIDVGNTFSLGCSGNTFQASNSASFTIGGDFKTFGGTFTHNNGTITLDTKTSATISSTNNLTFYNLSVTTPGKILNFQHQTSDTPTFTIAHTFTATGGSGSPDNLIKIQSDVSGTQWEVNFSQAQSTVTYVLVKDSGCAVGSFSVAYSVTNSGGGNVGSCWNIGNLGATGSTTVTSVEQGDGGGTLRTGGRTGGGVGGGSGTSGGDGGGTLQGGGGSGGGVGGGGATP